MRCKHTLLARFQVTANAVVAPAAATWLIARRTAVPFVAKSLDVLPQRRARQAPTANVRRALQGVTKLMVLSIRAQRALLVSSQLQAQYPVPTVFNSLDVRRSSLAPPVATHSVAPAQVADTWCMERKTAAQFALKSLDVRAQRPVLRLRTRNVRRAVPCGTW